MRVRIPVYVEGKKVKGTQVKYEARPLFFDEPTRTGQVVSRVLSRLNGDLRQVAEAAARALRHQPLATLGHCPPHRTHLLKLSLPLRRTTLSARFLLVVQEACERKVAFTPSLPELFFEIAPGEGLEQRAIDVYSAHYRQLEKDEELGVSSVGLTGEAWITIMELDIAQSARSQPETAKPFAHIGGGSVGHGSEELRKVGYCLDHLYPDELQRAFCRVSEVDELTRLLDGPDQRPILLVGPSQVGKTTLVHEYVHRSVAARAKGASGKRNVWQIAPQRIIAGMSFLGQWEGRLLAILKEARRREHLLFFDNVLGLFSAGRSAGSDLNVAMVLKNQLEDRRVRVLAEATPETLRVLREQDRRFADLFHVVPVREPPERDVWRILLGVSRDLTVRHDCFFEPDGLRAVVEMTTRYARTAAMPGKAVQLLRQLAVKRPGETVQRAGVLVEFAAKSGLSTRYFDQNCPFGYEEVVKKLETLLIGQRAAVEAMAAAVTLAAARLNDPGRPLASLLFLGPTGVGKTQAAKALAQVLSHGQTQLLRLDMNEYVLSGAAARLTGTFRDPEGTLTGPVRQNPFGVVLLDEIEKANPEVFDILLQVLGEGRLSDGIGRTVDFSHVILILTSNLGVREAGTPLGFAGGAAPEHLYLRAVRKFFRPELYNRFDAVVPFATLPQEAMGTIARTLLAEMMGRDGLSERRCVLKISPDAMNAIVREGYHPELGARALRRALERRIVRPVATKLAQLRKAAVTVVSVDWDGSGVVPATRTVPVAAAVPVRSSVPQARAARFLSQVDAFCARIDSEIARWAPPGEVDPTRLSAEHLRYFAACDLLRILGQRRDAAEGQLAHRRQRAARRLPLPRVDRRGVLRPLDRSRTALMLYELLEEEVKDEPAPPAGEWELLDELNELAVTLQAVAASGSHQFTMQLRVFGDDALYELGHLESCMTGAFDGWISSSCKAVACADRLGRSLLVEGPVAEIARRECGFHVFLTPAGHFRLVEVLGSAEPEVIRIYAEGDVATDARTRMVSAGPLEAAHMRQFIIGALARVSELEV